MSQAAAVPAVLMMRGASIGYDERPTVQHVDFTLRRGDVVALVGPNGSGKTTLVRGFLGLARVMSGQVELFGTPAAQFNQRWRIGYVPQRHTVAGAMPSTVREVVASGRLPRTRAWARPTRADREAVDAAIATVGLTDRAGAPVATLSGGQQRRVLIARALAGEPEVLVMDEPTAGVDAESQARLVATLEGLVGQGLTLLIVTHEVAPIRSMVTRVVALRAGQIVADVPARVDLAATLDTGSDPGHDPGHDAPASSGAPGDPLRVEPGWLGAPTLQVDPGRERR